MKIVSNGHIFMILNLLLPTRGEISHVTGALAADEGEGTQVGDSRAINHNILKSPAHFSFVRFVAKNTFKTNFAFVNVSLRFKCAKVFSHADLWVRWLRDSAELSSEKENAIGKEIKGNFVLLLQSDYKWKDEKSLKSARVAGVILNIYYS